MNLNAGITVLRNHSTIPRYDRFANLNDTHLYLIGVSAYSNAWKLNLNDESVVLDLNLLK